MTENYGFANIGKNSRDVSRHRNKVVVVGFIYLNQKQELEEQSGPERCYESSGLDDELLVDDVS